MRLLDLKPPPAVSAAAKKGRRTAALRNWLRARPWAARISGVAEVVGYGSTQQEALVGLTVRALRLTADLIETGELIVEDEPVIAIAFSSEEECHLAEV